MIVNKSRKREFVDARRIFAHLALKYCTYVKAEMHRTPYRRPIALPQLGTFLDRDHSTIINNCEDVDHMLRYDHNFDKLYTKVEELFTRQCNPDPQLSV